MRTRTSRPISASIRSKRVEIVGAFLKALPPVYGQTLGKDLGGLNTQPTLNGMLDVMEKVRTEAGSPVPFDHAGMRSTACARKPLIPACHETEAGTGRLRLPRNASAGDILSLPGTHLDVAEKLSDLLLPAAARLRWWNAGCCRTKTAESLVPGSKRGQPPDRGNSASRADRLCLAPGRFAG